MRLLFLTQTYPRFDGDTAGPFIRDLARGLVARGDSVTVLTPHAPDVADRWTEEGVEALSFRYAPERFEVLGYSRSLSSDETIRWGAGAVTPLYAGSAARAVRGLTRDRRFDLVHAHWVVPNGIIAAMAHLDTPFAVGLHGSDVFLAEKPGVRSLVAWAMKRAILLTGCSPELVDRVCRVGFDPKQSHVIPYGVNVEQFHPDPSRRGQWRKELGIPDEAVVGLGVGRMVTKKGFHFLLEVLPELLERFPAFHLILGGSGDRLEEFRAATEAWRPRVHLPGVVLRDSLPDLYRAADFFVLPAVHDPQNNVDGLPNVILEAMASGLPVAASGISGIPLAITDGVEGLLMTEQDPESIRQTLSKLLPDAAMRESMGRSARSKAVKELTWHVVSGRYRAAYEEALQRVHGVPIPKTAG